ncbi:MAG: C40 family peptidase [Mucilaginibacter sp.]
MEIKIASTWFHIKVERYLACIALTFIFISSFLTTRAQKIGMSGDPDSMAGHMDSLTYKYAWLMGVDLDSIKNIPLYNLIDQLQGAPYKYGGTDKMGIDCAGLSYLIEKKVYGITIPRVTGLQVNVVKHQDEKNLKEGDLVFFTYGDSETINQVGVYLRNGYFVHATSNMGVVIQNLRKPDIHRHFSAGGSLANNASLSSVK